MYETNDKLFELFVFNGDFTGGEWKIITEVPVITGIVQEVGMIAGDPPVAPVDFSESPSDRVTGDSDEGAAGDSDEGAAGRIVMRERRDSDESATSKGSSTTGINKKWHEMNNGEILSAIRLGWSWFSWDEGKLYPFRRVWGEMTKEEKRAVEIFEYKPHDFSRKEIGIRS